MRDREYFSATLQPQTAPNKILLLDEPLERVTWPMLCSIKYNGVRGTTSGGEWTSRSGKPIRMDGVMEAMLKPILDYSIKHHLVLDGEFNATSHNTVGQTLSILAGTIPIPDDFMFKCFYELPCDVWNTRERTPMRNCLSIDNKGLEYFLPVQQNLITCAGEFESLIENTRSLGREGYILLNPRSYYKHGRATIAEGIMFKFKYYSDPEEGEIVGLGVRKERRAGTEGKLNIFGYSEQVHTQDSFEDTDIAGVLEVRLKDNTLVNIPFPLGFDLQQRRQALAHFGTGGAGDLSGCYVNFRRLSCENKDKPIAVKQVEIRDNPNWSK